MMEETTSKAVETACAWIEAYVQRRDVESALALMSDDAFYTGPSCGDCTRGKEPFAVLARACIAREPLLFEDNGVHIIDIVSHSVGGALTDIMMDLTLDVRGDVEGPPVCLRAVFLSGGQPDGKWLLHAIHLSLSDGVRARTAPAAPRALQEYGEAGEDTEELASHIPGGICSCRLDQAGSFALTTAGFAETLRCSPEDLETLYGSNMRGLILKDDHKRVYEEVRQYLRIGSPSAIEHRIRLKDGSVRWFQAVLHLARCKDGNQRLFMLYTDIDEQKRIREKIIMSEARYNLIMDLSDSIIYDWNIADDTVEFSSVFQKKFGYPPATDHFLEDLELRSHIHPDDMREHRRALAAARAGSPYEESIVRFRNASGGYWWFKIVLGTIFGESNLPVRVVGIMIDIDAQMRQTLEYRSKMMRDPMTQLYNKDATETLIRRSIDEDAQQEHAFIIIDLDDFKQVNDTYGHQQGDYVIKECAQRIRSLFRVDDIVGRVGGDEFVVFLRNIRSLFLLVKKVRMIRDTFRVPIECAGTQIVITCSIGISLYPRHGCSFEALYENADVALYAAKRQGKDQHFCYQPHMPGHRYSDPRPL